VRPRWLRANACVVSAAVLRRTMVQGGHGEKLSGSGGHGNFRLVAGAAVCECGLYTLALTLEVR